MGSMKSMSGFISETIKCRELILGREGRRLEGVALQHDFVTWI